MIEQIKEIAIKAYEQSYPTELRICPVMSVNPFKVKYSDKIILETQLILTKRIKDMLPPGEKMEIRFTGGTLKGDGTIGSCTINLAGQKADFLIVYDKKEGKLLKAGDNVLLIRNRGGQKFYVIDKVEQ